MIGERTIAGVPALTLSSDAAGGIEVAFVPGAGMVGSSLRHRGEELLGQRGGLPTYIEEHSTMGIPLLHPWANRVALSHFPVAGRTVELDLDSTPPALDSNGLPIHGLLSAASGWSVEAHKGTEDGGLLFARFDFAGNDELLAAFPFPHQVLLDASLRGPELISDHNDPRSGRRGGADLLRLPHLPPPTRRRSRRVGGRDAGERAPRARSPHAPHRRARAGSGRGWSPRRQDLRRRLCRAGGRGAVRPRRRWAPDRAPPRRRLPLRPGLCARR